MVGASTALCAQPFYRLAARQPAALAAVLAALLASGGHRSPKSTAAVGHYALQLVISFIRPPALAAAQVCPESWSVCVLARRSMTETAPCSRGFPAWAVLPPMQAST